MIKTIFLGMALIFAAMQMSGAESYALENPYRGGVIPVEMEMIESSEYIFVFIHGMGGSKSSFKEMKDMCFRDGISWVSFDLRGEL